MKKVTTLTMLLLVAASSPLWAIIDIFTEIAPSKEADGYHSKMKVAAEGDDKVMVTLPKYWDDTFGNLAWLVVCKKERKDGNRNFRYQVDWLRCTSKSADIELVTPVNFGEDGNIKLHLNKDLASRSYIVFGGFYDDGEFATVNLPAFLKILDED